MTQETLCREPVVVGTLKSKCRDEIYQLQRTLLEVNSLLREQTQLTRRTKMSIKGLSTPLLFDEPEERGMALGPHSKTTSRRSVSEVAVVSEAAVRSSTPTGRREVMDLDGR